MLAVLLFIVLLGLAAYGFSKLDAGLYLWLLDKLCSGPSYTSHLRGQVVWITGASSGIGEYLAYEFAKAGCRLALSGTNTSRLADVRTKCLAANPALGQADILLIPFDITDFAAHRSSFERLLAHFGGQLDLLINNAGRSQRAAFEKIDILVDEDMFRVNVFGPVHLTRVVLEHWKRIKQVGHVAVTSSVAGILPSPYSCTYSGTKYAIHGYFETLRVEAHKHVKVTLLCPGPVFSRILESAFTEQPGVQVNKLHPADSKRMTTERCARLCFSAIVNRIPVAWISIQPILTCCYLSQYLPNVLTLVLTKFMTEEKLSEIRDGR